MRFIRKHSSCDKCPLRDSRRVWGQGSQDAKICFIGEAPGEVEDVKEEPFMGPAGRFLMWGISQAGLKRENVWLTNVLTCRPPSNNITSAEAIEALDCCRRGFVEEIEFLDKQGVKMFVALGATSMHSFEITGSISKNRGSIFDTHGFLVMPTFHPSYLNRMRFNRRDTKFGYKYIWCADIQKATRISKNPEWMPPRERFNIRPSLNDVESYMYKCLYHLTAIDIETYQGEITVIGMAYDKEDAICVPFFDHNMSPYWSQEQLPTVRKLVQGVFYASKLMFQNALYDVPQLRKRGYKIPYENIAHDTMLLHHCLDPEAPHDLGFIVSVYGHTPYWKDTLKKDSFPNIPDPDLRTYNCRDNVVLHQIIDPMLEDAQVRDVLSVYRNEALPMIKVVLEMSQKGILVDKKALKRWATGLQEVDSLLSTQLHETAHLPEGFNLDSGDDLRWFIFGIEPKKFTKLVDLEKTREGTKKKDELRRIKSIKDNIQRFYDVSSYARRRTHISFDEDNRLALRIHLQNEFQKLKTQLRRDQIEKFLEWLTLFDDYQKNRKLLSTYTKFPIAPDNRVHTSFLIHGTATRRLSSREPNMQNIPDDARVVFVAEEGKKLVSFDYSNLEVRILAYEIGDEPLIEYLDNGGNIHDLNAQQLFKIDDTHELWEIARDAAKVFQFGGISYGGGDQMIHREIVMKAPQLKLTFSQFVNAKKRWLEAHPAYVRWREEMERRVNSGERRFYDAFGRVRLFLNDDKGEILKQALNFPIQSGAAYVINRAAIKICEGPSGSDILLQVHDELLFELEQTKGLAKVVASIKDIMEEAVDYRGRTAVFPVNVKKGKNWRDMK